MLDLLPPIRRLHLADVTLPATHPRAGEGASSVYGYLVEHPDGPLLVDTGVGVDNALIERHYAPVVNPIEQALAQHGHAPSDIVAVINTHLHFDHCGQNDRVPAPTWVQRSELEMAARPRYTVPEWAAIDPERRRVADGDTTIALGVTLLATPGHTPGHQSVLVQARDTCAVIVAQACHTAEEFGVGAPADDDMHDAASVAVGRASIVRLRNIGASAAYFSHDRSTWRPV